MNVTAKDLGTGKESKIRITASTKLSKEEKDRLIKDADQYAEQDKKKREEAELRNNADSLVYTAERTKTDLAGKISQEEVAKIDAAVTDLKNALASNDMAQVKAKSDALQKVLQEVGTKVYQQAAADYAKQKGQQPGQGPEAGAGPQPPPSYGPEPEGPGPESSGQETVVDSEDYKVK
jgi:molecular chaperone DnaK